MAYRNLAKRNTSFQGPTAPRKRYVNTKIDENNSLGVINKNLQGKHPLTDLNANRYLKEYELQVKGRFDSIVPLLKKVSALQHENDFVAKAQKLTKEEKKNIIRPFVFKGKEYYTLITELKNSNSENVSQEFPDSKFTIVDFFVDQSNVESIVFKEEEGSFLAFTKSTMILFPFIER